MNDAYIYILKNIFPKKTIKYLLTFFFSLESTLAFLHSRRLCRLSSSFIQPTIYSKRTSIFLSLLSIISLLPPMVTAQQQRNPSFSSSNTFANGSSISYNTLRRRISPTTPISSLSTPITPFSRSSTSINHESGLTSSIESSQKEKSRSTVRLVIVLIVCPLMIIITIVGNLVVILSVCLVRKLRTASNILIVSLAVSDILVGLFIMPLAMGNK